MASRLQVRALTRHLLLCPASRRIPPPTILLASSPLASSSSRLPRSRGPFFVPMAPSSTSSTTPAAPGAVEWLVVVPDVPGVQAKRLEVRAQHLTEIQPLADSGVVKTGGAILNEKPEGTDASKFSFYGSTLVCVGSSRDEVLELLKRDIYATSGVWDLEKVQIWPVKTAFRNP
ncbi:hypothetical protein F4802DRAFT_127562 [Xylaria palmicola]|nr:hypothetical protein F4802DRAFT_127562 [Xylaria palmicola]